MTDRRTAHSRVFRNEDGSINLDEYTTPIHYQAHDGTWRPIDNTLRPLSARPGWVGTDGNAWNVSFGPLSRGLELSTAAGTISVVPSGSTAKASNAQPETSHVNRPIEPRLPADAATASAVPTPAVVTYRGAEPGVDLRYEVEATGVKEDIVLASSAAPAEFSFEVLGADLVLQDDGGVRLSGAMGDLVSIPAPTVLGANGTDLSAPSKVHYRLRDPNGPEPGVQLVVAVDREWLLKQEPQTFPLVIDPSFFMEPPTSKVVYANPSGTYSGSGIQIGSDSAGKVWRAAARFNQYESYFTGGWRVYYAALTFEGLGGDGTGTQTTIKVYDHSSKPTSWSQISGTPIATRTDSGSIGAVFGMDVEPTVSSWVAEGETNHWFGFQGTETGASSRQLDVRHTLEIYQPPPPTVVTIDDGQVLSTATPELHAVPVPNGDDGAIPWYSFQITTGPQLNSGAVWSATPSSNGDSPVQVPVGVLQEGVTYYAWAFTSFNSEEQFRTAPVESRRFTVNLGLGEGGSAPTDKIGAVPGSASTPAEGAPSPSLPASKLNVNMVNGNLSVGMGTKSLSTLSGGLSVGLTYNSMLAGSLQGLRAEFFNDVNGNGEIDEGIDALVAERTDPAVSYWWGLQAPVASQDPTKALVRWTGRLTLPSDSDTWKLGAHSSGGVRVTVGDTVRLNRWTPHLPEYNVFGSAYEPEAGGEPITVEWRHGTGEAIVHLIAEDTFGDQYDLAPEWLSRPAGALPAGWTLSADAASARWIGLEDHGSSVSVKAADGSAHEFTSAGNGVYTAPITAPSDLLSLAAGGRFVLQGASGETYTFRPDGDLESLVTVADDHLNPAALTYGYGGAPLRLRTIHDQVSNRTVTLYYGGDLPCGAVPAAAAGMLCQISYWDSTVSALTYDSDGRLIRLAHPGSVVYDLAYFGTGDNVGKLKSLRDPLAFDAVSAGVRSNNASVLTEVTYDSEGRVSTVTQPAPTPTADRPQRTYTYGTGETEVDVAGFNPPEPPTGTGFAERVRYDERSRITERTDAAGLKTSYTWDAFDRQVATTEVATGLRTTTLYEPAGDPKGRPTKKFGPASSSLFGANGLPLTGGTVPTTVTEYDGGISGLAATYWTNPHLAGSPGRHGTGLGTGGDMDKDWSTSPPVTPGTGGWSARFAGDLKVTAADNYTFQIETRGSRGRVWVDDELVADLSQSEPATGWGSNSGAELTLPAGLHRIRVDMVDTSGPSGLRVLWMRDGAPTLVTVPGTALSPAYGLITKVTDPDGKVTQTEYFQADPDPNKVIGPEYRLPTASVVDPDGANLRTVTTYETPGAGSFLRRIGRTLPAGNTSSSINYGGTDVPLGSTSGGTIGLRGATAAGNTVTSEVVINKPVGVATGDVLIAGIATRGGSDVLVVPPDGWSLIRTDTSSNSLQLSSYWHLAGSYEPASYTWNLTEGGNPASKAAAGTITAYTGVNPLAPIDAFGGQVDPNSTLSIVAPSITTTVSNARVVGLFTIANSGSISPPGDMTERHEANSNVSGQAKIAIESADLTKASPGATGSKTATGSGSGARTIGQLVALRSGFFGPCSVPATTPQAGQPKRISHADPDGAGPQEARAEEFVYDAVGRQVGRRVGTTSTVATAAWSCATYDTRGRLTSESWPATATAPTRTVTHLYAVGGTPLVNAVSDSDWGSAGIAATVDLLGRTVSYTDIYGDTTATTYDRAGRVTNVNGPGGNRTQTYTAEGRPGAIQVDGMTMATPTYNSTTGRLTSVVYANGTTTTFAYDDFGRTETTETTNGAGTVTGDQLTFSHASRVTDQQVYTGTGYVDANPGNTNYAYDGAGRLTEARLPGTTYAYGYGTSSGCTAPDAAKNTNRSTLTITGSGAASKAYCYDHADRLVSGTDYATGTVVYDDHGNTTQLGNDSLDFDASDRHVRTSTATGVTRYLRDPLNRIVDRIDMTKTTYVGSATAAATGTGVTVNRPTGTQAGDLIVAGLTIANPGANLSAAGWTVAATQVQGTQRTWVVWRYATAADPTSWTLGTDGPPTNVTAALATYRGPTALTPVAVTAVATTTGATSHPLPQVTTTSDANQLIHVVGLAGNATATVPSGITSRATQAGAISLLLADRYLDRPSTAGVFNATTGTAMNSASLTIAVVPATTAERLGHAGHSDSPSHLDDSTGALIERYYSLPGGVTITEKATTQPTTVLSDDFTGTNGAGWNASKWTATSNDSTKKVDIQSNQGELYVNGSSARATADMTPVVDSEATFSYRFSDRNATSFLRTSMRASGATAPNQMPDAYRLEVASNSSTVVLQKFLGSSVTPLDSFTYTANTSIQRVRFRVQGNTIQAKLWPDGTAEPSTWSLEATDSAVQDPGVLQIAHSHTSGARSVYLDDLVVTSGSTPDRTWSYSNLHGDVTATADNSGTRAWVGWYGPYGENPAGTTPDNANAGTWGWHGQQQRLSDRNIIHMGARPYASGLGRFLAVDPIEGGCANDYVYVFGDPVNQTDLSGKGLFGGWCWKKALNLGSAVLGTVAFGIGAAALVSTPAGWVVGLGLGVGVGSFGLSAGAASIECTDGGSSDDCTAALALLGVSFMGTALPAAAIPFKNAPIIGGAMRWLYGAMGTGTTGAVVVATISGTATAKKGGC